ncbi:Uncharacterised protein [Mycobacterium tuberculosis]|nr:Uncharacterised protein [Mycobacterium tuberculosis]
MPALIDVLSCLAMTRNLEDSDIISNSTMNQKALSITSRATIDAMKRFIKKPIAAAPLPSYSRI